jgi:ABC-type transport system involved in multi-copper enzyme maturation permease subunit
VLCLALLLGGIDPEALVSAFLIALGIAVLGCSLALTLSLWGSRTHEVLMATYGLWIIALLFSPAWWLVDELCNLGSTPLWVDAANPFWLTFAPYLRPGLTDRADALLFLAVTLAGSAVLVLLATVRVRAVTVRQASQSARPAGKRRRWRWWLTPSLDGNPVRWREAQRRPTSRWTRLLGIGYVLFAVVFTVLAVIQSLQANVGWAVAPLVSALQASVGLLLLSLVAVTSLAEERARHTLDVLLTTPLTTGSILWGKWWGTFRLVLPLSILPGVIVCVEARMYDGWAGCLLYVGLMAAYGAALTSLGLALATWIGRFGRAVTAMVIVYALVTIGWMAVTVIAFGEGDPVVRGLAAASPFYGIGGLTATLSRDTFSEPGNFQVWIVIWTVVYTLAAAGLCVATYGTFDRCLGRMTGPRRKAPRTDGTITAEHPPPAPPSESAASASTKPPAPPGGDIPAAASSRESASR